MYQPINIYRWDKGGISNPRKEWQMKSQIAIEQIKETCLQTLYDLFMGANKKYEISAIAELAGMSGGKQK